QEAAATVQRHQARPFHGALALRREIRGAAMQVILLERVEKLGQMGDEVRVKDGFARNFLLPKKKALRATKANREYFQTQKVQLEAHNLERKKDAEAIAKKLDGKSFILIRQAGDRGQLYGSVSPRDVAAVVEASGFKIDRNQ